MKLDPRGHGVYIGNPEYSSVPDNPKTAQEWCRYWHAKKSIPAPGRNGTVIDFPLRYVLGYGPDIDDRNFDGFVCGCQAKCFHILFVESGHPPIPSAHLPILVIENLQVENSYWVLPSQNTANESVRDGAPGSSAGL